MPSFPDLHDDVAAGAPVVAGGPVAPADVLARVKSEGLRRRTRRHRRNGVLAALGIALLAVPAVALLPEGGAEDLTVASDGGDGEASPRTTEARRPATTATTATTLPPPTTATTVPAPTDGEVGLIPPVVIERESPPTTQAPPPPTPTNEPATITITPSNPTPVVGEEVVFTVRWSDPDASLLISHTDTGDDDVSLAPPLSCGRGSGEPPAPRPGSGEFTFTAVYDEPGTYTPSASVITSSTPENHSCDDPYSSEAHVGLTITVTAASA